MTKNGFDQYAEKYDAWFMENPNVLQSEVKLVAYFLNNPGNILSVGCGSGLFEYILKENHNITIKKGIEPSEDMAKIARKRGMEVDVDTAEKADFGNQQYDTILFNGTPGYIDDLEATFIKAYQALNIGGRLVVIDIPKESAYGLLYNLAKSLNTWDHPMLKGVHPKSPYPIEFVKLAIWRTTGEKAELMKKTGFEDLGFAQTLTRHPAYSDDAPEEPAEGYDRGDYVAICGYKKS